MAQVPPATPPSGERLYSVGMKSLTLKVPISSPKDVFSILDELRTAEVEIPVVLHVDSKLNLLAVETCAIGSMMSVSVEARTIFARAVRAKDDRSIILVHNHAFQKEVTPSMGDRDFFQGVKTGGKLMGIHIHDSVIIGMDGYYSFMEHGISVRKDTEYRPYKPPLVEDVYHSTIFNPSFFGKVMSAKKAFEACPFLRGEDSGYIALLHLTPDMEATVAEVFPRPGTPEEMTMEILRNVISRPSTKYFILIFGGDEHKSPYFREIVRNVRLGSMVLCVPLVDAITMGKKDFYSFSEHGEVFPKSKAYVLMEDEGLKLKGPSKTGRSDIPPYSWTFR